jgi:hypothetical protein
MKTFALAPLLLAAACATSPYGQPYAEIVVDRAPSSDPNVVPGVINRVDGETSLHLDRVAVSPGPHQLTIDVPPRKGFRVATQETVAMDAEPCTRYYIAARLDTPVTQDWKPLVRSTERIAECESRFKAPR